MVIAAWWASENELRIIWLFDCWLWNSTKKLKYDKINNLEKNKIKKQLDMGVHKHDLCKIVLIS